MAAKQSFHVVYILTKLELGGAQKICLSLLKGVRDYQVDSFLVSGTDGKLIEQAQQLGGVHLIESFKREVGVRSLFSEVKTFISLIAHLRSLKKKYPNLIVHTHSTKAGILGRWAAFFAGISKRFHTVHGFGFHPYQNTVVWFTHVVLEWLTSLITTRYICVSEKDRARGCKYFPRFGRKSVLIRAAVDFDTFFMPARVEKAVQDSFIFGAIGCFKPQKNLLDLFKAFHGFHAELSSDQRKRVVLQVIGDGVLRPHLEKWIADHEMSEFIILLGWQADVASYMKSWDVMVSSSLWEGLPCALVEARLSKLPVIAYDVGGISEVIKNGENGYLVDPGNWHTLQKRMKHVFVDRCLWKKLSSYQDALVHFQNDYMVRRHVVVYKDALKKKRNKF